MNILCKRKSLIKGNQQQRHLQKTTNTQRRCLCYTWVERNITKTKTTWSPQAGRLAPRRTLMIELIVIIN